MKCPVCESQKIKLLAKDFLGYIEGELFSIYSCENCNCQFVDPKKINEKVYEFIYQTSNTPGYERYRSYANEIKNKKNPLKFLAFEEPCYYPTYKFLMKQKKIMKILEIGCSYGYVSYAISKEGHNVMGLDIGKNAIKIAKENFPNINFVNSSVFNFKTNEKFDLIIATEVVEHLENIPLFLRRCKYLLRKGGTIILTTPNRDIFKKAIWKTELPPVHTCWLSKKTFSILGEKLNFKVEFINFKNYFGKKELKILYLFNKRTGQRNPVLNKEGKPLDGYWKGNKVKRLSEFKLIRNFFYLFPIRYLLKKTANIFEKEDPRLGIVLHK